MYISFNNQSLQISKCDLLVFTDVTLTSRVLHANIIMDNKHLMVIYMLSAEIVILTEQFYALTGNI